MESKTIEWDNPPEILLYYCSITVFEIVDEYNRA